MEICDDLFEEMLCEFQCEFQLEFDSRVSQVNGTQDMEDMWRAVRELVLPDYPILEYTYKQHGLFHHLPYEEQPEHAKLGRKVAGVMFSTMNEYQDKAIEEKAAKETQEKLPLIPAGARYKRVSKKLRREDLKRTQFNKREKPVKKEPTKTEIFAEGFHDLGPGDARKLFYDEYKTLKNEQALLGKAAELLGWTEGIDDKYIIYESWTEKEEDGFWLVITRLEEPRLARFVKEDNASS